METINNKRLFKEGPYLMDGGLETTLIFHEGIELNHFASFELLNSDEGRQHLRKYYQQYLAVAGRYDIDFIFETPTWRASNDWGAKMGYSPEELDQINKDAVQFMRELATEQKGLSGKMLISGCVGPRGDGYQPGQKMTVNEAADYHSRQVYIFALADADVVSALTINYTEEAVGIALAAKKANIPVVISFTVETDGNLPSGESLQNAIEKVDRETDAYPEHFMINCAHPEHFKNVLHKNSSWIERIRGIRANASTKSHAELDESTELDIGDIKGLANNYRELKQILPNLSLYGGCCGTDHRHIEQICVSLFTD